MATPMNPKLTANDVIETLRRLVHPDPQRIQNTDKSNANSIHSRRIPDYDRMMTIPGIAPRPDARIFDVKIRNERAELVNLMRSLEIYDSKEMVSYVEDRNRNNPEQRRSFQDLKKFDPKVNVSGFYDNKRPDIETLTAEIHDSFNVYTNTVAPDLIASYKERVLDAVQRGEEIPNVPALVAVYPMGEDQIREKRWALEAFRNAAMEIKRTGALTAEGSIDGDARRRALEENAATMVLTPQFMASIVAGIPVPADEWSTRRSYIDTGSGAVSLVRDPAIIATMQALALYFAITDAHEAGRDEETNLHNSILQSNENIDLKTLGYAKEELQRWLNTLSLQQLNNGLLFLNKLRDKLHKNPDFTGPLSLPIKEKQEEMMVTIPKEACMAMKFSRLAYVGQRGMDLPAFTAEEAHNLKLPPVVSDIRQVERFADEARQLTSDAEKLVATVNTAFNQTVLSASIARFGKGFTQAAVEGAKSSGVNTTADQKALNEQWLRANEAYSNCVRPQNKAVQHNKPLGFTYQAKEVKNAADKALKQLNKNCDDAEQAADRAREIRAEYAKGNQNLDSGNDAGDSKEHIEPSSVAAPVPAADESASLSLSQNAPQAQAKSESASMPSMSAKHVAQPSSDSVIVAADVDVDAADVKESKDSHEGDEGDDAEFDDGSAYDNDQDNEKEIECHLVRARMAVASAQEHLEEVSRCRDIIAKPEVKRDADKSLETQANRAADIATEAFNKVCTALNPAQKAAEAHNYAVDAKFRADTAQKYAELADEIAKVMNKDNDQHLRDNTKHIENARTYANVALADYNRAREASERAARANVAVNAARQTLIDAMDGGVRNHNSLIPHISTTDRERNTPDTAYAHIRDGVKKLLINRQAAKEQLVNATSSTARVDLSYRAVEEVRRVSYDFVHNVYPSRGSAILTAGANTVCTPAAQTAPQVPAINSPTLNVARPDRNARNAHMEDAVNDRRQVFANMVTARRNAF